MAKQYTKQDLLDAVKKVRNGNSVKSTAKTFGIPHSTPNGLIIALGHTLKLVLVL